MQQKNVRKASIQTIFYEEFPKRLKIALFLGIIALLYFPVIAITFKSIAGVFPIMVIFEIFAAYSVTKNALRAMGLSRPALIIDDSGMTYRNTQLAWNAVSGTVLLQTPQGQRLGITLIDPSMLHVREDLAGRALLLRVLHREVQKYDALPLPPIRAMGIDELRAIIEDNLRTHVAT